MNILMTILIFLVTLLIIGAAFLICRKYIFSRLHINKWIPLSIAIALFIIQMFVDKTNIYLTSGLSIVTVLFFLWFMHITQTRGPKNKGKQIVIKPKAKPNRVKKNK